MASEMETMRRRFLADGWREAEVLALGFADSVGSNVEHANDVRHAVLALRARAGSHAVDIVAHSMGGLAVWSVLKAEGKAFPVRRVVLMASPLKGTLTAYLAWGKGGREMRPGSEFLRSLASGLRPQEWLEALTIRIPLDLHVLPGRAATLPGVPDRIVCCPTHEGLLNSRRVYRIARDFLLHGWSAAGAREDP